MTVRANAGPDSEPEWGAALAAAARGADPLLRVVSGPAAVAAAFGGRQPVYVATPYSREVVGPDGRWDHHLSVVAMLRAAAAADDLLACGVTALSPIVQAAAMVHGAMRGAAGGVSVHRHDPLDGALWQRWCAPVLRVCGALVVPDLPGWDRSWGIWHEFNAALAANMPVFLYAPQGVSVTGEGR